MSLVCCFSSKLCLAAVDTLSQVSSILFYFYSGCNYWDALNIIYLLGSCSSFPLVEAMKPQQHSKASLFMNITHFPEINHRDDWQVNCFVIFQMQIFSAAIKTKHNWVSIKRTTTGWSILVKIPVRSCDHPKICSAGIAAPFFSCQISPPEC